MSNAGFAVILETTRLCQANDMATVVQCLCQNGHCHGENGVGCRRHVSKVCTSGVTTRMVSCHAATVRAASRALHHNRLNVISNPCSITWLSG